MNIETAIKLITTHNLHISGTGWKYRKLIKELGIEPVKAVWLNSNAKWDWVDKPSFDKDGVTVTYDACITAELTVVDNRLLYSLLIWDGDHFDGYPTKKRCQFEFILDTIPELLEDRINNALKRAAIRKLEEEDELKYQQRLQNKINSMLLVD